LSGIQDDGDQKPPRWLTALENESAERVRAKVENELKWKYSFIALVAGGLFAGGVLAGYFGVRQTATDYFQTATAQNTTIQTFITTQLREALDLQKEAITSAPGKAGVV
jgi:hypothetical protein